LKEKPSRSINLTQHQLVATKVGEKKKTKMGFRCLGEKDLGDRLNDMDLKVVAP
jgi:hypothetical protein